MGCGSRSSTTTARSPARSRSRTSSAARCSRATVGYWVDESRNGRGLAGRALAETVELAFGELELHRLEAGTLLDNAASQRVLRRNAFTEIGVARKHLLIGGAWRDHLLFERLADD